MVFSLDVILVGELNKHISGVIFLAEILITVNYFEMAQLNSSNSDSDESFSELLKIYTERAYDAKQYLDRIENSCENDSVPINVEPENINFEYTVGKQNGSRLIWTPSDEMLYTKNKPNKTDDDCEKWTCYIKNCSGRLKLQPDGLAFQTIEHTIQHGTMYHLYIEMKCREMMRDLCKSAGASKSISDIYEEAITM